MLLVNKALDKVVSIFDSRSKEEIDTKIDLSKPLEDGSLSVLRDGTLVSIMKQVCSMLGFQYSGRTFEHYVKDGGYKLLRPSVYSDGKTAVLNWGGTLTPLKGEIPGICTGTFIRLSSTEPKGRYDLAVSLEWSTDREKEKAVEEFEVCETWEELEPLLRRKLEVKSREDIYRSGTSKLEVVTADLKEKNDREYWAVTVKDDQESIFLMFVSADFTVHSGMQFQVDCKAKTVSLNGEIIPSGNYVKLKDLEAGEKYRIVGVTPAKGEYGGLVLECREVGFINSNSQFERWFNSQEFNEGTISPNNAIILTVTNHQKLAGDRVKTQLWMKMEDSSVDALDDLLGAKPKQVKETKKPKIEQPPAYSNEKVPAKEDVDPRVEERIIEELKQQLEALKRTPPVAPTELLEEEKVPGKPAIEGIPSDMPDSEIAAAVGVLEAAAAVAPLELSESDIAVHYTVDTMSYDVAPVAPQKPSVQESEAPTPSVVSEDEWDI